MVTYYRNCFDFPPPPPPHCIANLWGPTGIPLTFAEFKQKYDVNIDCVAYRGLALSVKKYIRGANVHANHNVASDTNVSLKSIYFIHKGTKLYYNILVKNNVEPNCCSKWIAKLNCDISWKCCFQKIRKTVGYGEVDVEVHGTVRGYGEVERKIEVHRTNGYEEVEGNVEVHRTVGYGEAQSQILNCIRLLVMERHRDGLRTA